jgi:AcrR family transcriptional regulator
MGSFWAVTDPLSGGVELRIPGKMRRPIKMRRRPTQQRGEERVEQILDATEELVLEIGTESITTNHIASRAGVNVGTIYHFFADKFEIFRAVIGRIISALGEAIDEDVSNPAPSDVEWLEGVIDAHERFWFKNKGAIRLWLAVSRTPEMGSLWDDYYDDRLPEYARALEKNCPHIPASRRLAVARILNEVLMDVLDEAIIEMSTKKERETLLRELRFLLRGYICRGG